MTCNCVICGKPFSAGDELQGFLCSPDDPQGSWTTPVIVDAGFQERVKANNDNIQRKHSWCKGADQ